MEQNLIKTIFLDIGGVLLTNGWGRSSRALAANKFGLDLEEINERHHLCFDTYERGKLTMDEYLLQVVFYQHRDFTAEEFKGFIYAQSQELPENIAYFKDLKSKHHLKVFAVNNEAKEMNEYRIKKFRLLNYSTHLYLPVMLACENPMSIFSGWPATLLKQNRRRES